MAMRLNTSLLILGLVLGSLAVAHASRELLDDKKEDKRKCYPRKHQKKCPRGKVEDCLKTKSYHGYVKVSKKTCFNDKYSKDTYAISYTNKEGHPACTDGYTDFYAKCNTYVKLYIVDAKYYNKNGQKYYLPKECKYNHYKPCSVCDYNSFKVKCKKEEEYKPYYSKDKEDKHEHEYKEKKDNDKKDDEHKHEKEYKEKKDNDKNDEDYKHEKEYKEKKDNDKKDDEHKHEKEYKEKDDDKDKYKYKN